LVVKEQIGLNIRLSGFAQECELVSPEIGIVALDARVVAKVTRTGGGKGQEVGPQYGFVGGSIGPEGSPRLPVGAQALADAESATLGCLQYYAEVGRQNV